MLDAGIDCPGVAFVGKLKVNEGTDTPLAGLTSKVSGWLAVFAGVLLSVTETINWNVPTVVGVPLMTPVAAFRVNPAGKDESVPGAHVHARGVVPFTAVSVAE
jgi:hypothetical protein